MKFLIAKLILLLSDRAIQDILIRVATELAKHTSFTWDDKLVEAFDRLRKR